MTKHKKFPAIKYCCKTTHIEVAVTSRPFKRGRHCWLKPGFGLGLFEWKRVAEGGPMKFVQQKKTCWHITWLKKPHWMRHKTWVRLISHEIILQAAIRWTAYLSLTARPLTLKLLSHGTFLRGECIAGQSFPTCKLQWGVPHKLHIKVLPTTTNWFKGLHMSSWRIVGYVRVSRDTAHPKIQATLIFDLQTSFEYGFTVDTAGLAGDSGVTDPIVVSVSNKWSSFQQATPHLERAEKCKELKFKYCSLSWCHSDHLEEFHMNILWKVSL